MHEMHCMAICEERGARERHRERVHFNNYASFCLLHFFPFFISRPLLSIQRKKENVYFVQLVCALSRVLCIQEIKTNERSLLVIIIQRAWKKRYIKENIEKINKYTDIFRLFFSYFFLNWKEKENKKCNIF